jgi:hypothetical protein
MSFSTSLHLQKATRRAKSDVANKLVSMLLHEISRALTVRVEVPSVNTPAYTQQVEQAFGSSCLYCSRVLENERAAVEHFEGMNRFRLGLHIPGNVAVACVWCNREKRRDDQMPSLVLAHSGWESFLAHDGSRCAPTCKTCAYWRQIFPNEAERTSHLQTATKKIHDFRVSFASVIGEAEKIKGILQDSVEELYRECQSFATERIDALGTQVVARMDAVG